MANAFEEEHIAPIRPVGSNGAFPDASKCQSTSDSEVVAVENPPAQKDG